MFQSLVTHAGIEDYPIDRSCAPAPPTLIILLAGTPVPSVLQKYGSYHQIFCQLFHNSVSIQDPTSKNSLRVLSFDIVDQEYPSDEHLESAIGLLVTGSGLSTRYLL